MSEVSVSRCDLQIDLGYSKGLSHRNRLAGGSQSISKFSREIEPTVSQFLNVHGKFIQRVACQYIGFYFLSVLDNWRSGEMPVCDDRSILVAIQVDTVRPHVCLTTLGDTL